MNTQLQTEIFDAMARPDFYPHHVSTIERRETHISKVFLTDEIVRWAREIGAQVIVCIDFSNSCSYALKYAIKIAQERHSNLFIFHMLPIPPSTQYSQAHYRRDLEAAEQKLREFCKLVSKQIDLEYEMWGGAIPHVEILAYARRCEADLIVMGSHTKERRGKWYVGSAVERVSCRSLCPVVVVSDPKALLN